MERGMSACLLCASNLGAKGPEQAKQSNPLVPVEINVISFCSAQGLPHEKGGKFN